MLTCTNGHAVRTGSRRCDNARMAVFAVHFSKGDPDAVSKRIEEKYPKTESYALSSQLFLVRADTIAERVAESLGIKGADKLEDVTGVVFKLNSSYSGFDNRAIWDWLALDEQ